MFIYRTSMFSYFVWISRLADLPLTIVVSSRKSLFRGAARRLHEQELRGICTAAPSFFMNTPAGQIVNRFSEDIAEFDISLPFTMLGTLSQGLQMSKD
jgi:hypothetical protein